MLTKKNLWFLTLFSIIVVMSVYYVSVPSSLASPVNKEVETGKNVEIEDSSTISALKVEREEALEQEVNSIKSILTDDSKTTEEKSDAYEALKGINLNKGKEETLETLLKKNFNYDNFVKIDGSNVKVVIDTKTHSYELANQIIMAVEKEFDKDVYITVSFGTV